MPLSPSTEDALVKLALVIYAAPFVVGWGSAMGMFVYSFPVVWAHQDFSEKPTIENKKAKVRAGNIYLALVTLFSIAVGGALIGLLSFGLLGDARCAGLLAAAVGTFASFVIALKELPKRTQRKIDAVKKV